MFENKIKEVDILKQKLDQKRPLDPQLLQQLKEYFRIGLTYSSNALEGNSLTETETKIAIEDGLTVGGKPVRDYLEAIGHSKAYDLLYELVQKKGINEEAILHFHQLFFSGIDEANAGAYRTSQVFVTGAEIKFPLPAQVPSAMKAFAHEIPALEKKYHPIEYAAIVHLKFVNIHPFIDGNGRTARLLMNLALMQHGYTVTIIPPLLRREYITAIKAGNHNDYQPFINLLSNMVYESMQDYLRLIGE